MIGARPTAISATLALLLSFEGVGAARAAEPAPSEAKMLCGLWVGQRRQAEVKREGRYDKFRHCALSCVITLKCGPMDAYNVGLMKELYDALGFGEASLEDLRADVAGIDLALERDVDTRADCYRGCDKIYPRNATKP